MKKNLYIFILAAAAGVCAILSVIWTVDGEKGNITVTETVVEGDVAAAEGIMMELGTHWEGQLLWSTRYQPGRVQEADSSFDFYSQGVRWSDGSQGWVSSFTGSGEVGGWKNPSTACVRLDVASTHFGTVHVSNESAGDETGSGVISDSWPFARLLQAAEDLTPAGETRTVNLRLRDYYDYYPVKFSVVGEDGNFYFQNRWQDFAAEYFKFPIPEDEMIQVSIRKDRKGRSLDLQCQSTGEGYFPVTTSVSGDGGYWFSFYLEGDDKSLEELQREFWGRYAVYWLPAVEQPAKGGADMEQMRKAAQLPEGAVPVTMQLDREGQVLYLLALQKERYILLTYKVDKGKLAPCQQITVYDMIADTDADIESARAGEGDPGHFRKMTVQEDGILLTWRDNRFAFIAREGEECRLWCSGVFPADAESGEQKNPSWSYTDYESAFPYEHTFAFDGTRLALAAFERWGSLDSRLLVYRDGMLAYSGYYQYSQELDAALGMYGKIIPWGDNFSSHRRQGTSFNPLHVSIQ